MNEEKAKAQVAEAISTGAEEALQLPADKIIEAITKGVREAFNVHTQDAMEAITKGAESALCAGYPSEIRDAIYNAVSESMPSRQEILDAVTSAVG